MSPFPIVWGFGRAGERQCNSVFRDARQCVVGTALTVYLTQETILLEVREDPGGKGANWEQTTRTWSGRAPPSAVRADAERSP